MDTRGDVKVSDREVLTEGLEKWEELQRLPIFAWFKFPMLLF